MAEERFVLRRDLDCDRCTATGTVSRAFTWTELGEARFPAQFLMSLLSSPKPSGWAVLPRSVVDKEMLLCPNCTASLASWCLGIGSRSAPPPPPKGYD